MKRLDGCKPADLQDALNEAQKFIFLDVRFWGQSGHKSPIGKESANSQKQTFLTDPNYVRFRGKSGHKSPIGKESANSHKRTLTRLTHMPRLRVFVRSKEKPDPKVRRVSQGGYQGRGRQAPDMSCHHHWGESGNLMG